MSYYRIGTSYFSSDFFTKVYDTFKIKDCEVSNQKYIFIDLINRDNPVKDSIFITKISSIEIKSVNFENYSWLMVHSSQQAALLCSSDYLFATIYTKLSVGTKEFEHIVGSLIQSFVEYALIAEGNIILHSACVKLNDFAVAFSGKSGTGKSTRASKWVDELAATWISGDRPLIDPRTGLVYGVPWDGKEQVFVNDEAVLKSILQIKRSNETKVYRTTSRQALAFLSSQVLIPMWDPKLTAKVFSGIKMLIKKVPLYTLYSDGDKSAAIETKSIIFDECERINDAKKDGPVMKLNKGFEIVNIADEYMIIPVGDNMDNFGGTVVVNEVSAFLLNCMKDEISKDDLLEILLNEYDVDRLQAEEDLNRIIKTFVELDLID